MAGATKEESGRAKEETVEPGMSYIELVLGISGLSGDPLVLSWTILGLSWAVLGLSGAGLVPSARLGPFGACLGPYEALKGLTSP